MRYFKLYHHWHHHDGLLGSLCQPSAAAFSIYDDDEEVYNDEDDRGECDSDDEKTFMKENYETVELPSEHKKKAEKKSKKEKAKKEKANKKSDEESLENDVESEYVDLLETKKQLTNQLHKKPKSKILLNAIEDCNKSIKKLVKKARIKNAKAYHKLIIPLL